MKKIMIIGSPGAGKTTLAIKLSKKLNLPIIHLDQHGHTDQGEVSQEDLDIKIAQLVKQKSWVMDGHYNRTLAQRLPFADTVIFLDYSRWQCLWGVLKRFLSYRGKHRSQIPGWNPGYLTWTYLKFIWDFPYKRKRIALGLVEKYAKNAEKIILSNRRQTEKWLESL